MSTALTNNHAAVDTYGFEPSKLQLITDTIAKGCTAEELQLFLYTCQRTGLDPLARQIYCIKRWDSTLRREVATPQTSIDGYRLIADRTGNYAPGKAPTYEEGEGGGVFAATAYVMKYVRGTWHEVSATAYWDEYAQTKTDGSYTKMWQTKPRVMLGKCAEALALRRAFPAELSGLYTQDEMGTEDSGGELPARPASIANPPANRVLTQDAAAYRLRLWHGLETLVGEARVLGIATNEVEQAQMEGDATNEEIIAHGQQLRAAINKFKVDAELNPASMEVPS